MNDIGLPIAPFPDRPGCACEKLARAGRRDADQQPEPFGVSR